MRHLPDWLRRQRAQWLMNLGRVAVVDAASNAVATLRAPFAPEFPIHVIENAFVAGDPAVISRRLDLPFNVVGETVRYRGSHGMVKRFLRHDLDPARVQPLGDAMCLAVNLAGNFHHWLLEILPNAALAEASGFHGTYVVPDYPYVEPSLALLGINAKRQVPHTRDDLWRVARLHVAAPLDSEINLRQPALLRHLRDRLKAALPSATKPRRLYVSRNRPGRTRRVLNEPELKALLDRFGFETFFAEDHSIADQLAAFSAAEAVVGNDGAGLANALVMPRGALLVALFSPLRFDPGGTLVVARLNHLRYFTIFAHTPPDMPYPHGEDVIANLELLETTLERELA